MAESLRAERDEEEGLFDSLGVFLSSPEKLRKTNQVCYLGDEDPRIIAIMGGGSWGLLAAPSFGEHTLRFPALPVLGSRSQSPMVMTHMVLGPRVDIQLASIYWGPIIII